MRVLPAVVATLLLAAPAHAAPQVGLGGRLAGAVTDHPQPPDVPTQHELTGTGTTNLGPTQVHGTLQGTGFVEWGTCSGALTLTTRQGTLTLRVSSARIGSFSECPTRLSWRISRSTGSLSGSTGSGTMLLTTKGSAFRLVFDGPGTASPPGLPATGLPTGVPAGAVLLLLSAGGLRRRAASRER